MTDYFVQAFIYLVAAVIAVPIAKRLGLGSVLGYLLAGIVIGPVIGLVGQETTTIQHFAEFGVVMMLFLVGLELEPRMLWEMRSRLLGLGGLQVSITAGVIALIALALGQSISVAITIGLIFSLSSTAIVLQTFNEKGLTRTDGGRSAFSILLFQDIAVIPMLAVIPLLAIPELAEIAGHADDGHHNSHSLLEGLPGWLQGLTILGSIAGLVLAGHYLSRPLFNFVASSRLREVFTAAALMLIIGIAALMSLIGLSPALGTFIAGVVLANSEFRHELESNIEPFKGLLLGLFFITVGAGINFGLFTADWMIILGLVAGVMLLKALILYILARIFGVHDSNLWLVALSLAQAGEFGFVLLSFATQNQALPSGLAETLSLVVALSMLLTPALFILFERVILPRYGDSTNEQEADDIDETGTVVIAGVGRFGQIVNRLLVANGVSTIVLDHEAVQVENLRKVNIKSYFGDATRPELLHTAGIDQAKLFVIAIDNPEKAVELVEHVAHDHPNVKILARAFDRGHGYRLTSAGADFVVSETYYSALELGGEALKSLNLHPFSVEQRKDQFVETENSHYPELFESWKQITEDQQFLDYYRELFMKLEEALGQEMQGDRSDRHSQTERGWTPPPKDYLDKI